MCNRCECDVRGNEEEVGVHINSKPSVKELCFSEFMGIGVNAITSRVTGTRAKYVADTAPASAVRATAQRLGPARLVIVTMSLKRVMHPTRKMARCVRGTVNACAASASVTALMRAVILDGTATDAR